MKKLVPTLMLLLGILLSVSSCWRGSSSSDSETSALDSILASEQAPVTEAVPSQTNTKPGVKAASVDSMKMVVDYHGNLVGRYVRTNSNTYTVAVQDTYDVPKAGNRLTTYSAKNGQGILYTYRTHVNIRQQPTTESPVVTQISYDKNSVPETYPCLGKSNDWYKILVNGREGYVRQDLVVWDGMDTF